jgi:hypothetical protein
MQTRLFKKGNTNMKTIMKTSIYLPMAAMFLTAALTRPAVADDKLVPFSGSLQAHESATFPVPGTLLADGSGGGIATLLGRFTETWLFTVNTAAGTGSGPVHYIAANGDDIFTTSVGQSQPTDTPGVFRIVEIQTIIGGTGRFAGAKGSFTVDRLTDLNTGFTSGSFHGTITSPGAAH